MANAPGSVASYNIAPGDTQADVDLRRKLAMALMQGGMSTEPIQSPFQGLAKMAQSALGGYQLYGLNQADQEDRAKTRAIVGALFGSPAAMTPQAGGAPAASAESPDMSVPRGLRNNNPGNIENGSFAQSQPGYAGVEPKGRFATFDSPQSGMNAVANLLASYGNKGINTVSGVIGRYAPSGDGNNVGAYAQTVAGKLGVAPDQQIDLSDPNMRSRLASAIAGYENGQPVQMAQAGPTGTSPDQPRGGITPDRRAALIQELASTRSGAPYAQALISQQLTREQNQVRPLNGQEKQVYPGAVAIDANGKPIFPPPQTNVSLNASNQGEGTYAKGQSQKALDLENSYDQTFSQRQQLDVFKNLVQGFQTGKLAPAQTTVGAWADALGIDPKKLGVPENAAINGQLIESLSNQMTLGMIGGKGGAGGMPANNFSDADRKFLQNTVPGLARMQGGNLVLAEIKSRGLDRQLQKSQMWDQYKDAHPDISVDKAYGQFEREWRKKISSEPSMFADIPDMVKAMNGENPGAAPPASPAPAAPGANFQKGDTATNPKTGQKIMWDGTNWVPAQGT